jgi:hypothetical protein
MTMRIQSEQAEAGLRRSASRLCCIQVLSSAKSKRPQRLYSGGENNFLIFSTGIGRLFRSAAVRDEKKFFFKFLNFQRCTSGFYFDEKKYF